MRSKKPEIPRGFFFPYFSHLLYAQLLFYLNFLKLPSQKSENIWNKEEKALGKEMRALIFVCHSVLLTLFGFFLKVDQRPSPIFCTINSSNIKVL